MSLYPKQSLAMLVDLINSSNPSLPVPVSATNLKYGTPTAVNGAAATANPNTTILVTAAANSQYIGKQTLGYRRIDLGTLFRGVTPIIAKYSAAAIGSVPYKLSDLLNDINQNFGLSLTTDDFTDAAFPTGTDNFFGDGTRTTAVTLAAKTTSLGYQGSVSIRWKQAPQVLANVVTTTTLATSRQFPSGNTVDPTGVNTPYVIDLDFYTLDFTDLFNTTLTAAGMQYLTAGYPLGKQSAPASGYHNTFLSGLNALLSGKSYSYNSAPATQFSLYGAHVSSAIDLTTAANQALYPDADFKYFNTMRILTLDATNTWGCGQAFLHYNV